MLVACSWGLSPSWSSFEQISPTIESWNGIKKVYVTSRQEEAHIKRKREMRGFERKKNRYIYISTKALVAQWEFRWRINWQISSQLPAYPVSLWKTQGRLMRLCHRVSPRRSFPFSTNGKQRLRAERFHRLWCSARLRSWCSGTAASKFQISDRKLKDLFLFSFFFFLESAIVIGGILSNSFFPLDPRCIISIFGYSF